MRHFIVKKNEIISLLKGKTFLWYDQKDKKMIKAVTAYIPFGCPDWGETNGVKNNLCAFCAIPNAVVEFRKTFYKGKMISSEDIFNLFRITVAEILRKNRYHTLMIFNGGSFLAMPDFVQIEIIKETLKYSVERVVIESRAELITAENIRHLTRIFQLCGKFLTVRIGIETQDDYLRLKVLRKGHTREQLRQSIGILKKYGIASGGYVLLNPAPGLEPEIAINESINTIDWILSELKMDEVYFCSANVGFGTELERAWHQGSFRPANLWMVFKVLNSTLKYGTRIHLLPFKDEPPFLAIPSNHTPEGIPQNLAGAKECDLIFHEMFEKYRQTRELSALKPADCACKPDWF